MDERNPLTEIEGARCLVVEQIDSRPKIGPEFQSRRCCSDNSGAPVTRIGDTLDEIISLEPLQDTIEILPTDDQKFRKHT
jgi:hypothetical protein